MACLNINFLMVKIYDKGRVLCKGKQNIILFILFSIFNVLKLLLSDLFSIPIVQKMLLLLRPRVPDDPRGCQMDGCAILNQYRFLIQSFYLQKTPGQGVRTHPPMVLSAMIRKR